MLISFSVFSISFSFIPLSYPPLLAPHFLEINVNRPYNSVSTTVLQCDLVATIFIIFLRIN